MSTCFIYSHDLAVRKSSCRKMAFFETRVIDRADRKFIFRFLDTSEIEIHLRFSKFPQFFAFLNFYNT